MNNSLKEVYVPEMIQDYIMNLKIKKITKAQTSGDFVYQIGDKYILKISENVERLKREKEANDFLAKKVPVSQTICFVEEEGKAYYLKTQLKGNTLLHKTYLNNPEKLAKLLAEAIHMIHNVDVSDCELKNPDSKGDCFVHGDFCLPNILVRYNKIVGFVDTEASGIGDAWMDYAWCIWSYEHNLGTKKYTHLLLDALGITFDEEKFDMYTRI